MSGKFILFVGVIEERKNISGILHISDILLSRGIDIKFVFIGREGFGLPPLEAMKSRITVLSSNNPSLSDVVGEGGLLSDAVDYESFAQNIILLLRDDEFYFEIKSKVIQHAKKFTPEMQMPKLIEIFHRFELQK